MKRIPFFAKAAAIVSSFGLIGLYVYDQAGGNVLPWLRPQTPQTTPFLPGSKSKTLRSPMVAPPPAVEPQVTPAQSSESAASTAPPAKQLLLLPGSKSAPAPINVVPLTGSASSETRMLLPGSKSFILPSAETTQPVAGVGEANQKASAADRQATQGKQTGKQPREQQSQPQRPEEPSP